MVDRVGQQFGNYRIMRLLGEGGFAEVYLGEHLHLGTQAAIKVLHTQLTSDDVEQFRSEARTIARLEHPNIIRVLDFGIEGKTPYLVMSYAPNGTLRQYHGKGVALPLATVVTYVRQVADALQYAHDQKVIHRDVKPENMLLGRRHEVLLSDFGIALVTQSSRYQGTHDIVGTVAYMAPEQIQGKPRPASDQYSLGVVVYEWITGERPFQGSFTEVAVQHAIAAPPPLHQKLPTIPRDVELVVLTALAKAPEQRFANIQAFANALEQVSSPTQRSSFAVTPQWTEPLLEPQPQAQAFAPIVLPDQRSENTILATPSTPQPQYNSEPGLRSNVDPTTRSESRAPRQVYSRRAVLVGIVGLAAVAGSGLTWLALSQKIGIAPARNPTVTPTIAQIATRSTAPATPTQSTTPGTPTTPPSQIGTPISIYRGHTSTVYGVTWASLDGRRIASAGLDTSVQEWNANPPNSQYFTYHHSKSINDVKASKEKQFIASAGDDNVVQVRDAAGNFVLSYTKHTDAVYTVDWAPDGSSRIVTASKDNTVQIWDAASGTTIRILQGHTSTVWAAGWSPDGKYVVSASADGTAIVWDATSGTRVSTYKGHSATVRTVSWSPDKQSVATGSEDNTVQIWNAFTVTRLLTYHGHNNFLRTVAWSHDGSRIVSGGRDKTAQIWNPVTGNTIYVYTRHSNTVFDAQWAPDDRRIASGSIDTTVQVWYA
ncbi:MAG TPA: serine/threonine-protein kinase [Ktedonobacteraceae bacterium]